MPRYRAHEVRPPSARFGVELLERAIRATVEAVDAPLPDAFGGRRVRRAALQCECAHVTAVRPSLVPASSLRVSKGEPRTVDFSELFVTPGGRYAGGER